MDMAAQDELRVELEAIATPSPRNLETRSEPTDTDVATRPHRSETSKSVCTGSNDVAL
jgi:hypothetical protein